MSNYKCTRSFKSQKGKNYYYGNKIGQSEYNTLYTYEQGNFQMEHEESGYSESSNSSSSLMPDYGSSWDSQRSDSFSSSDSSSFDFGGGDGGGGGSTGDW